MRSSRGGEDLCRKAREYYYDLLYGDRDAVPEAVARHVEQCSTCQRQMECLRVAFSQGQEQAGRSAPSQNQGIVGALSRQFELLGECVTCSQARPSLPDLLIPSREIRIPTPVTVHVEHCPQCAEDLALLGEQGLTADQLRRLSLFYGLSADPGPEGGSSCMACPPLDEAHDSQAGAAEPREIVPCRHARPVVAALAAFSFDGADTQAFRHVIGCPQCRTRVYRRRARIMDRLHAGAGREGDVTCRDVSASDLFDGVMPLGLEATVDGTPERRHAVFAHVRTCRQCMEKAQSLHRAIYAIGERADSGIDTVYQPEPVTEAPGEAETACRYPIRVRIVRHKAAPSYRRAGVTGRRLVGAACRSPAGVASLAAFVIIAAAISVVTTSTATATMAGEIRQALKHAATVHILQFHRANPQPLHEMWIAQDRNVLATRNPRGPTEYIDFGQGSRTTIYADGRPAEHIRLSKTEYQGSRELMSPAGMLANLPANADLQPVESDITDPAVAATTVYERSWESPTPGGATIPYRLTIAIDPATRLPGRMVLYERDPQGEWSPLTTTVFEYLDAPQMEKVLTELLAVE